MKTELKSQFQLVSVRLLISMTNCLQIYLKNCDFYVKMTYFWGSEFGQFDRRFGRTGSVKIGRRFGRTVRFGRSLHCVLHCNILLCLVHMVDYKRNPIRLWNVLTHATPHTVCTFKEKLVESLLKGDKKLVHFDCQYCNEYWITIAIFREWKFGTSTRYLDIALLLFMTY